MYVNKTDLDRPTQVRDACAANVEKHLDCFLILVSYTDELGDKFTWRPQSLNAHKLSKDATCRQWTTKARFFACNLKLRGYDNQ